MSLLRVPIELGLQRYIFFLILQIFVALFCYKYRKRASKEALFPKTAHLSERNTEFEAKIVDSLHAICAVSVCAEAVIGSKLEAEISLLEREVCESNFR